MNLAQFGKYSASLPKLKSIGNRSHQRKGFQFTFRENFDKINQELLNGEKRNRKKAVRYIAKKMRQVIKQRYGKGNLYKGVGVYDYNDESRVGYRDPAQHAHLLELGTDSRIVSNWMQTGKPHKVGYIKPEPILIPLLKTEREKVIEIMSEPWV